MSIAGFKSQNHPQQTNKRGARDEVDDRGTASEFIASLEERSGDFTLDVAAAQHNAKAPEFYDRESDGLSQAWARASWCHLREAHDHHHRIESGRREWCRGSGPHRIWCNPPYSDCGAWVRKAWREFGYHDLGAEVEDGNKPKGPVAKAADPPSAPSLIVMLLPANRVEQKWWQEHVEPFRDRPGSPLRVEFLPGRMRFVRPGWTPGPKGDRPPFGCCLLTWGGESA